MEKVVSNSPYPIYKFSRDEFFKLVPDTMGICDFCNCMPDDIYLITHVNRAVCKKCYEDFIEGEKKLDYIHDKELLSEKEYMDEDSNEWVKLIKKCFEDFDDSQAVNI